MVVPCPGRGSDAAHTLKSPPWTETNARQAAAARLRDRRPAHPLWGEDDSLGLARRARGGARRRHAERFLARRAAAAALRRLGPRESHVRDWLAHPLWRGRWMPAALGLGLMLGLVADALGACAPHQPAGAASLGAGAVESRGDRAAAARAAGAAVLGLAIAGRPARLAGPAHARPAQPATHPPR